MAARFRGEYSHSIDAKGRLIIPVKYREALGEEFMISKGFDGCLFVFTMEEWDRFEEKLTSLPMDNQDARDLNRFFISGSCEVSLDKQGRILLPPSLIKYAAIEKDAVVLGVGTRAEIWSKERREGSAEVDANNLASKMSAYGLRL